MARKVFQRDIDMLEQLAVTEKGEVAKKHHLTIRGLDSWLHRLRKRKNEIEWYFDKIRDLERRYPRIQKILLSAELEEEKIMPPEARKEETNLPPQTTYCPFKEREVPLSTCDICKVKDWNQWKACQDIKLE